MINNDAYLKAIDSMLENGDVQSPSGLMLLAYLRESPPANLATTVRPMSA